MNDMVYYFRRLSYVEGMAEFQMVPAPALMSADSGVNRRLCRSVHRSGGMVSRLKLRRKDLTGSVHYVIYSPICKEGTVVVN